MSNLSDLLPAGASAKSIEAVASGTLASGQTVGLNTDGTVSAIGSPAPVSETIPDGVAQAYNSSSMNISSIAFDPNTAGEFVIAFIESGVLKAIVGNLSGTTATFGTPVTVSGATTTISFSSAEYNPNVAKQFVIAFVDGGDSNKGKVALGTVAASAITMEADVTYDAGSTGTEAPPSVAFDPNTSGNFVISYREPTGHGAALVCSISGTTITANSPTNFTTGWAFGNLIDSSCDPSTANKVVIVYQDGRGSDYGKSVVGTVSGTSISFGAINVFESAATQGPSVDYNPATANHFAIAYKGSSQDGKAILGTISGTTITYPEAAVTFDTGNAISTNIAFDPNTDDEFVISYDESSKLYIVTGTASATTVALDTPIEIYPAAATNSTTRFNPDSDSAGQFMTSFRDDAAADYGTLRFGQIAATQPKSSADFVGIADEAISDTATGVIVVQGGTKNAANANVPEVISFGSASVFESASTEWTAAAFDSNSNKVVIAYEDEGNSSYGTAVVGTVSGTSISWGTPVVFESASVSAYGVGATFDSNENKVVIAYSDVGNSTHGTAIVGTVSGTSISYGTPVVFNAAVTYDKSVTFDSDSNKVVIAYRDGGNSYHGYGIVGTVSGTAISFGTGVNFEAASTQLIAATFDSNLNKVVIAYNDEGNSQHGTAVVGTVSGTAISFGTPVVFEAAATEYTAATFDSGSNKVVIAYRDSPNSDSGTAIVGTVSGTAISFGTAVVYNSGGTDFVSCTFASNVNKVVIAYRDVGAGSPFPGTAILGTVSGTAISFATAVVFEAANTQYTSCTFDSNSNKVVIAYMDDDNSDYGTGIVGTAGNDFTVGSNYYVQADGTLTTVSSSVSAGLAISTTSLLLSGDS